ncbi:MAG: hypothetical protein O7A98_03980, partial [Acidobacteria bacterium]|nr:hypothetical protein [Acidobacteriota bacterium]
MRSATKRLTVLAVLGAALALGLQSTAVGDRSQDAALEAALGHLELPDDPFVDIDRASMPRSPGGIVTRGPF